MHTHNNSISIIEVIHGASGSNTRARFARQTNHREYFPGVASMIRMNAILRSRNIRNQYISSLNFVGVIFYPGQ